MSRARLAALAILAALPAAVRAQDTGWRITRFHADYVVHEDRSIGVIERIAVDFGPLERHGIYREIPIVYRRVVAPGVPIGAGRVRFSLDVRNVTDGAGIPIPYEVSGTTEKSIRIGDPDRTVSGPQTYVIDYRLSGGLGFFEEFDELYWQVTGTEWPVPIETVEEFTGSDSTEFHSGQLRKGALVPMENEGAIEVTGRSKRRTYPSGSRIRFL